MEKKKTLYRSKTDRIIFGVCGGLGAYFDIDTVLIRVAFIVLVFMNGIGLLVYIILALLTPSEDIKIDFVDRKKNFEEFTEDVGSRVKESVVELKTGGKNFFKIKNIFGFLLIVVGLASLMKLLFPFYWFGWNVIWASLLILVGLYFVFKGKK